MMDIKYILDYLREEMLMEPIAGVTVGMRKNILEILHQ